MSTFKTKVTALFSVNLTSILQIHTFLATLAMSLDVKTDLTYLVNLSITHLTIKLIKISYFP